MSALKAPGEAARASCHLCSSEFWTRMDLARHLVVVHRFGNAQAVGKARECFFAVEPPRRKWEPAVVRPEEWWRVGPEDDSVPADDHLGYATCTEPGCYAIGEVVYAADHTHRPIAVMNPEDEVDIPEEIPRAPRGSRARILAAEPGGSATMPPRKTVVRACSVCRTVGHRSDSSRCPGKPGRMAVVVGSAATFRDHPKGAALSEKLRASGSAPPVQGVAPPPPPAATPAAPSGPPTKPPAPLPQPPGDVPVRREGTLPLVLARQSAEFLRDEWRRTARALMEAADDIDKVLLPSLR